MLYLDWDGGTGCPRPIIQKVLARVHAATGWGRIVVRLITTIVPAAIARA
jgi:hypothetical protein